MVSSDQIVLRDCHLISAFQCLNRQMVSSDTAAAPGPVPVQCFNASIGRWCLQTRPLTFATPNGLDVSMPQSADGVFRRH